MAAEPPVSSVITGAIMTATVMTHVGMHVGKFCAEYTDDALFRALNAGTDTYQLLRRRNRAESIFAHC